MIIHSLFPGRHIWRLTLALLLCWLTPVVSAVTADGQQVLPQQEAYRLTATAVGADMVQVTWDIAQGYYLYRNKLKFSTLTPGVSLGDPVFPPAQTKTDEFFGQVPIYRGVLHIDVPVVYANGAPSTDTKIDLAISSQGCADLGVCYPPLTQNITINMPASPSASDAQSWRHSIQSLTNTLATKLGLGQGNEFLQPDQAFVVSADVADHNLKVRWNIADGYYLYRNKFSFSVKEPTGIDLGPTQSPHGKMKEDENFGQSEVYYKNVELTVPVIRNAANAKNMIVEVRYQGCADKGLCYPPITKEIPISVPVLSAATLTTVSPPPNTGPLPEQDRYEQSLRSGNLLLIIGSFFSIGLLLAFTPCMFPMIPILSSLIAGQGETTTTRKAFSASLAYVLAMAVTYTALGVIAASLGKNLQPIFQNPWVLGSFSAIFVALALSMFGFFEIQMPSRIQTKLTHLSNSQTGGSLIGAGIMGFLSALIIGPCMAAPLAGALIYIAQSGDAVLGGTALFAMSMGMGLPLLIIGTSAGKLLPRAGDWMNTIKAIFGVTLLGLAIWMLERLLPPALTMLLWAGLLIVSAVYMGALERLGPDATGWRKLWQGAGLVMLIYGALLMFGALSGGQDIFQPLRNPGSSDIPNSVSRPVPLPFERIKGLTGFEQAMNQAKAAGKPVMLDFYADWCVSCKEMEKYTFNDKGVQQALRNVILLQADVTKNDADDAALLKQLGVFGPPSILFFGANGEEQQAYRLVGFINADKFRRHVEQALQQP